MFYMHVFADVYDFRIVHISLLSQQKLMPIAEYYFRSAVSFREQIHENVYSTQMFVVFTN